MPKLPVNERAERAVLGALYLEPENVNALREIISTDDFSSAVHRNIWKAMLECVAEGQLDLVTLDVKLKAMNGNIDIKYIVDIANETPNPDAGVRYAKIVSELAERRRKMAGLNEAMSQYAQTGQAIFDIDSYVQNVILAPAGTSRNTSFAEAYSNFQNDYERKKQKASFISGISTGYADLDIMTGGLEAGQMYVIGARPSIGKTAFALNLASNLALNHRTVIYFSLEMRNYSLVRRISAYLSKVDARKMQTFRLAKDEYEKMDMFSKRVGEYLLLNDDSCQSMSKILSNVIATNMALEHSGKKIDCVFIDHLQLIQADEKFIDRRHLIGEASKMCKIIAERCNCPVVAISQLNRANTERKNNNPSLSDLKESGDIEQDADVVMLLHRDGYYDEKADQNAAKIIVAKNRDGMTGTLNYTWNPSCYEWAEKVRRRNSY